MRFIARLLVPSTRVSAHCDLPCGVYDPAQARIDALAIKACMEKYSASDDEHFRTRAIVIKEQLAEQVKHHLWVLWTDYFKPEHAEKFPQLHQLFWDATKSAGQTKKTTDVAEAERLLGLIEQVAQVFADSKK